MRLTVTQLKALKVVGKHFQKRYKTFPNAIQILVSSKGRIITSETLIENVECFRECVINYVKKSARILGHSEPVGLIARLSVLQELWSLVEITVTDLKHKVKSKVFVDQ